MDAKLFLAYLPWLRSPDYNYIAKKGDGGWSEEDVASAISDGVTSTTPIKRSSSVLFDEIPIGLGRLYADHSLEKLSMIGGISFWSEPKKLDQGWGFADMSEVNLVVAPSGQIEAYAAHPIRAMPGATDCLGSLAKDLESYLEALFCAQFNRAHFLRNFPDTNPILFEKTVLVAKHCALIAGGYEYYDFWAGLLGLPPIETIPD